MSDTSAQAARLLAAALQVDQADVDDATAIGVTERWDSLAHMRLVLGLEEYLGEELNTEEMLSIETYGDVVSFLDRHAAE